MATILQFRDYCRTQRVEPREGGAEVVILPVIRVERVSLDMGRPCTPSELALVDRMLRRSLLAERP